LQKKIIYNNNTYLGE